MIRGLITILCISVGLSISSQASSNFLNLSNGDIVKYDFASCTFGLVGSTRQFYDIAFTPNGILYGFDADELYSIDTITGASSFLGGGLPECNSLVGHSNGLLYGVYGDEVYSIDPTIPSSTFLGTIPHFSAGDLFFRNDSLYMASEDDSLIFIDINNVSNSYTVGFMTITGLGYGFVNNIYACDSQQLLLFTTTDEVYLVDPIDATTTFVCNLNIPAASIYGAASLGDFVQLEFYDTIIANACDSFNSPYSNSSIWYTSGTYNDTVSFGPKCDSIHTIILTIGSSSSSSISVSQCDSLISPSGNYTWYVSGTYYDTIPNAAGCDSNITINLSVDNSSIAFIFNSVCDSLISPSGNYTWYVSGTYYDTIPNAAGCDSNITINLTLNNSSSSVLNPSVCDSLVSPSGNYTWYVSGTYYDTIPNAAGCDSNITIHLSVDNSSTAFVFNSVCDSLISPSGNYTWYSTGVYQDTIPNAVGCDSVITINLTIRNTTYSSTSVTACDSLVSPSGNYTWYLSGTYYDTIPNLAGCDSVMTMNLTISSFSITSLSPIVCDSFVSPSGNYTWYTTGNYQDTIVNPFGCDSIFDITVTVSYSTSSNIFNTTCDSMVSPSGNYIWYLTGIYQDTIPNLVGCDSIITINLTINNSSNSIVNLSVCDSLISPSGNYIWYTTGMYQDTIVNANGCDSVITINLIVNNSTSSILAITVCDSLVSPSGTYTWYFSGIYQDTIVNVAGCDSIITVNLTVNNSSLIIVNSSACDSLVSPSGLNTWYSSGTYYDTLTSTNGCDSIIQVFATITNTLLVSLSDTACDSLISPSGNYTWYVSGTYYDTVLGGAGCDTFYTIYYTNFCDVNIEIPQFFSPNGDGSNDTWHIRNIEFFSNNVKVFNRWGTMVFQMENYNNSWDGTPNTGTLLSNGDGYLPSGTYFYILEINNPEPKSYMGYLNLRR